MLSNFLGLRDARRRSAEAEAAEAVVRSASPGELGPALRLVLGPAATEEQVRDFITFAGARGIDLQLLCVAEREGRLTHAALPVVSPGRTMLLFVSPPGDRGGAAAAEEVVSRLIDAGCRVSADQGAHLAQALIDPGDEGLQRIYAGAGFRPMAELLYLQGSPRADAAAPVLPPHCQWVTYSEQTHAQFAEAIVGSYEQSLDCPALNGLRDVEDVILGHKASGVFDPSHWLLLCQGPRPMGVLLLASSGRDQGTMELVYLGLAAEARGRSVGQILMKQALAVTVAGKHERLSLAVDARNVPALKLYYRHGMNRVAAKVALLRDLRDGRGDLKSEI
jgi:ribosomal protein S18 acetylase RimI-like enzyme